MDTTTFVHTLRMHSLEMRTVNELSAEELGHIVQHITTLEAEEGGPYADSESGEIDLGLNVLIALFLNAYGVNLPKLDAYLAKELDSNDLHSSMLSKKELVEYIAAYQTKTASAANDSIETSKNAEEKMIARIWKVARERFQHLLPEMQERAEFVMNRTIRGNPDTQMSLMPYYLREALGSKGRGFSDEHIGQLGLANIFFWTAFIVYDDFWDEDEAADPQLLPVANLFARHYTDYFSRLLPEESGFRPFFHGMLDKLDMANEWETIFCRMHVDGAYLQTPEKLPEYGNYERKFYPAAGHVMGPVAMLLECGFAIDSQEVQSLITYFRHYLIAMQLNDDAHDWKEDLRRGHLSTVVTKLLQIWCERYPESSEINFETDMPELEKIFWFELLEPFCEVILEHAAKSRAALEKLTFLEHIAPLEQFIIKNENAAHKAIQEKKWSTEFLSAFSREVSVDN